MIRYPWTGGVLLFGPAGILAALASTSPGDENPCLTILDPVKKKRGKSLAGRNQGRPRRPKGPNRKPNR
jgi:hypothetical protein